jgi:hypothetical protein
MSNLAKILSAIILLGTLMGAGPGLSLASPAPDASQPATVFGIPVLYAWVAFWFLVQAAAIFVASEKLWKPQDGGATDKLEKEV